MTFDLKIGKAFENLIDFLKDRFDPVFDGISTALTAGIGGLQSVLLYPPSWVIIGLFAALAWRLTGLKTAVLTAAGLLLIDAMGLWDQTMVTLAMVLSSAFVALLLGIPLGIWSAYSPRVEKAMRPVLDLMQTMPAFVYLIPAVLFFRLGKVPGVVATVIFAMPPAVRLTSLGIRQVPREVVEAAIAFGSTPKQLLLNVQLPDRHPHPPRRREPDDHAVPLHGGHRRDDRRRRARGGSAQGNHPAPHRAGFRKRNCGGHPGHHPRSPDPRPGSAGSHCKMNRSVSKVLIAAVASCLVVATGCKKESSGQNAEADAPKRTVKLAYVNWAEGVAMTHLAAAVLEDKLKYEVETTMADVAPVFTALAEGDADAFLDSWLPVTHKDYLERFKGKVDNFGTIYQGARIGLAVPAYMEIDSIEQLNSMAKALDGSIIGIDSGAGIMTTTEKAIEAYALDLKLVPSSGPAMTAALKDAIDDKRPVVVTGWKPHWKFARWELKFLEDPKGVYGDAEKIHVIARLGLDKDLPEVAQFLRNFKLDDQQLGSLMGAVSEAKDDPAKAVRGWMEKNAELVNSWLAK